MKIQIELPDWCDERNIRIMAGVELAAYKLAKDDFFHIKKVRCSMCGDCCRGLSKLWFYGTNEEGNCVYLKKVDKHWECGKDERPFSCATGRQEKGKYGNKSCTVEYKKV